MKKLLLTSFLLGCFSVFGANSENEKANVTFSSSNLPILIITTDGGVKIPYHEDFDDPKIDANLKVINNLNSRNGIDDIPTDYDGTIGIEVRGNYSAHFDHAIGPFNSVEEIQKPFGFETREADGSNLNTELLGMPSENDWILVNNIYDKTLMRHSLAYHLFDKMGHYAPRAKLCEVVLNDDYHGVYMFTERIKQDKNRVNISNLKDTDIEGDELTGGYIFKVDYSDGDDGWVSRIDRMERGIYSPVNFIYHDPKKDDLSTEQAKYLEDYVHGFESVLFGENFDSFSTGYRTYIDVPSFIDYMILSEVSHNIDAYKKSKYYSKDKDSKGGKINAGPAWDYDWAWRDYGSSFESGYGWAFGYYDDGRAVPDLWINRMMEDPYFTNQIYDRYNDLRETILSEEYIFNYIDSVKMHVDEAQKRHFTRWPVLGEQIGYQGNLPVGDTYAEEVNNMKDFISRRLDFLDDESSDIYTPGLPAMPSGIEENALATIRTFPNPADDYVFIESEEAIKQLMLYDLKGETVLSLGFTGAHSIEVDLTSIPSQVYTVKIITQDGKVANSKLVKR